MTSYIKKLTNYFLPQNQNDDIATRLSQKIQSLKQSLSDKTGEVFKRKLSSLISTIQAEKDRCVGNIHRMNGSYYQDPRSTLKKAWDKIVDTVDKALGVKIQNLEQLPAICEQLNEAPATKEKETAKQAIDAYRWTEKKRDTRQKQLHLIIGTEKAEVDPEEQLKLQRELLKQKHLELCGSYFGDPRGTLDQAWQKYQTGEEHLAAYKELDEYRKQVEAKLFDLEQQLAIPASPDHTYEILTSGCITSKINALENLQKTVSDLTGADWKEVAHSAGKAALTAAGYFLS